MKIAYGLTLPEITAGRAGRLITIYKKFSENPVGKSMDHAFLGHTGGTPGAAEHLKRFFHMECS